MEKIKFTPHDFQQKIIDAYLAGKKKIVVSAGQRAGKSMTCAYLVVLELLADKREVLVVSPSYSLTDRVFENVRKWLAEFFNQPVDYQSKPFPRINMPWGSYVEGKSADAPEQILGKSYDLIVVDEASRIGRTIYENYLLPRIGEKQGRIVLISTPLKKDFFWELWVKAKEDDAAFQFGTISNPHYPVESIETFQKQLPKAIFEREFLGVFTDELTSVFPNAYECINPKLPREATAGSFHYIGLDVAREEDFSAITVVDDKTNEVIYIEKWNKMPYTTQLAKVLGIVARYRPCKVIIDSRGPGAVLGDELRASGIAVEDWTSTGTTSKDFAKRGSKTLLVEKTIALFSSHSISIPNDQGLLDELSAYSYNLSPLGNISYSAPQGLHDDQVESLMMACWNLEIVTIKRTPKNWDATPTLRNAYYYPEIQDPNFKDGIGF